MSTWHRAHVADEETEAQEKQPPKVTLPRSDGAGFCSRLVWLDTQAAQSEA